MNSIILFTERDEWLPDVWMASMEGTISNNGLFVVETSNSWLSVYRDENVFRDYDDDEGQDEVQFIRSLLHDPVPYLIEWKGDNLLRKFVDDFPLNKNAVIDNDCGLICNISELRGKPIHDWLRESTVKK